jgi:hypothetical protein
MIGAGFSLKPSPICIIFGEASRHRDVHCVLDMAACSREQGGGLWLPRLAIQPGEEGAFVV